MATDRARRGPGRDRRPLLVGLGLSALAHGLLFLVHVPDYGPAAGGMDRSRQGPDARVGGLRAIEIVLAPRAPPDEPAEPVERAAPPTRPRSGPPTARSSTGASSTEAKGPRASVAGRLAPRVGDARLWTLPVREAAERFERARGLVLGTIAELADSLRAENEAARRAVDWTHTATDGRRWGASPNCVHLGATTLCQPNSRTAERLGRLDSLNTVQGDRLLTREMLDGRIRAFRERRERERGGGGPGLRLR